MITTIVFDIGNVLAHFGWKEYLQGCGYEKELLSKVSKATVESGMWKEWDRSSMGQTELMERSYQDNPSIVSELRDFYDNILSMVKEYDYSEDLVRKLKKNGYQVYVLSNYSRWHFDHDKDHFQFMKYIDGGIVSYQVQHIKPEAAIYEALISKYNINAEEAVFIDDVDANLDGAKPFGFHTILMQNYDQMLVQLRNLGVII